MSWDLGYLAGQAAERAIGENILAIKEGQWRQEINEVAAERNQLARKVQELEAHLREQIAYSDDLQRDLDRALQALAKAGANPTERQALSVAPHVRRQKLAEEERLRREKAEEQERQRRHQAYLASLPTPAQIEEMKQREELRERRRRRNFRILAITAFLIWGATAAYEYVDSKGGRRLILENWYVNRVLPLQKPAHVSLDTYGCLNCHHRKSGESFMVYESRFKRLESTAQKKEALTRMSASVATKSAVKRFDLSDAEVRRLATDITKGAYSYR